MCIYAYSSLCLLILGIAFFYDPAAPGHQLTCPDGSPVIEKGLHVCCGDYCVFCARISKDYPEACARNCSGTVIQSHPFCQDCHCNEKMQQQPQQTGGCPFGYGSDLF